jgi:hypothetical protein
MEPKSLLMASRICHFLQHLQANGGGLNGVYIPLHSNLPARKHPCTPGCALSSIYYDSGSLGRSQFGPTIATRVSHSLL